MSEQQDERRGAGVHKQGLGGRKRPGKPDEAKFSDGGSRGGVRYQSKTRNSHDTRERASSNMDRSAKPSQSKKHGLQERNKEKRAVSVQRSSPTRQITKANISQSRSRSRMRASQVPREAIRRGRAKERKVRPPRPKWKLEGPPFLSTLSILADRVSVCARN